ncbi:MAG: DNA polymerase III subunit delta [Bacteroidetes bacterium]|nr:DNA polymerase III subunit delta [Bacteroidota bacterium]
MTYNQIIQDLGKKNFKPVYFLHGEEPYYIDKITNYIIDNVLSEAEKSFNQTIFYGHNTNVTAVINAAKRFPMMANNQVVVLKEAQYLDDLEDLIHYVKNPLKSTLLVIAYKYKKLDKRKKLHNILKENALIFESNKLYDSKIPDWIISFLKGVDYEITPAASLLLTEYLGSDLSKIVNELEKLIIALPTEIRKIDPETIEKNIGISKDFNNFELTNALSGKDILKANRIVNYFDKNPRKNPITLTISSLYYFFSRVLAYQFMKNKSPAIVASELKIHPFFLSEYKKAASRYSSQKIVEIISLLRKYDLKSKGWGNTGADPGSLLKELIYKILH